MTEDHPRLIEHAFPIKQASLDSVHEKNVRHGHISTLHIWPARRPLAACRAALIATLLPDPGTAEERQRLVKRIGGEVVQTTQKKRMPNGRVEEVVKEETVGGVLHWGRESSPEMDWFREEIRKAYGGRAPKVLDPFAGGGAIPLEAMRLGCEATAIDINPVAWFILKCTLEYPQKLAGQLRPLPQFALESPEFMEGFYKGTGKLTKKQLQERLANVKLDIGEAPPADLAWHVRAWGWWVLQRAKKDLERFYPVIDGKPTVAYLWARTVTCKNCRATIPLLKTRWLCRKDNKRVLLTMEPNCDRTGVVFGVLDDVPRVGGNTAQRREYDKRLGAGAMSRSGAACLCCGTIMTRDDIQQLGLRGQLSTQMTAVVVDGPSGKEYRLPLQTELAAAEVTSEELDDVFGDLPYGLPGESLTVDAKGNTWCVLYGHDTFDKLFTRRQLLATGVFARHTRAAREAMTNDGYPPDWVEGITCSLASVISKLLDHSCGICSWNVPNEQVRQVFARFVLPFTWDFVEVNTTADRCGAFTSMLNSTFAGLQTMSRLVPPGLPSPEIVRDSAKSRGPCGGLDAVVTDPPYYDAIGYAVLMDFFYVWLRRVLWGVSPAVDRAFEETLCPKWDHGRSDGELVDDASRFGGDRVRSRQVYEDGMLGSFRVCFDALNDSGRLVVVFANKQPDAWEALASAMVRAGFVVDASWPIQTERGSRTRALASAALSSSVWLVCRKRPDSARPGWDTRVLEEMRESIGRRLRDFWDAGIRGPDFVWAATGPALEAYSKHPVVKKANQPDQLMTVSEFLRHVRRIVVDFVVGRVLSGNGETEDVSSLDDVTTYYLLHRHDFGMGDAPVGACILYAVSCNLSDSALADQYDILVRTGRKAAAEDEEDDEADDADESGETPDLREEGSGSQVKLKPWNQRKRKSMGYGSAAEMALRRSAPTTESLFPELDKPAQPTRMVPLIDRVHRLMHLWKEGDVVKVDEYLETSGMRHEGVFPHLLQALIELAPAGSEERAILESISNHAASRGMRADRAQREVLL